MAEKINIVIPTIGESVSEGTIGKWYFNEGDYVKKDQPVLEVDSDKATMEVPAGATGKLKIIVPAGKTAAVGALVGVIEAGDEIPGTNGSKNIPASAPMAAPATPPKAASPVVSAPAPVSTPAVSAPQVATSDLKGYGPSKRKAIREGTFQVPSSSTGLFLDESAREMRKPMSTIRKRIAERLLESQQTTATLTTFNEVDMSRAMELRKKVKDSFEKKHGVKLGFMSLFSKAVIHALQELPEVNGRIENGDIVYPQYVNLGMAVSTDRGLVVPVVRDAHTMSCAELERKIADLAERARMGKLQIPEMQGGTFTITNGGVFGSLLSTPILNPPQSGILGMHKIEQRPKAVEKNGTYTVEVRPMMYIALSYDHRLIDGVTSVGFLVKVKDFLEHQLTEELIG